MNMVDTKFMLKLSKFILVVCTLFVLFSSQKAIAIEMNGLVVESGETKIIENQKLIIEGNIIINPNGKLIVKNSDITLNSHYKNQYWLRLKENASLLVENSILREGDVPDLAEVGKFGRIENFRFGETLIYTEKKGSRVVIKNSTVELRIGGDTGNIVLDSSYCGIVVWTPFDGLKMNITDSNIQMLHIWLRGGEREKIYLSNLGKGKDTFHLNVEKSQLNVKDAAINRYSVALWMPPGEKDCKKDVIIENSDLSEIFAVFPKGTNIRIWDMKPGFYKDWNIYHTMDGTGLPWNLTLKNVDLRKWKLDFHGIADIENSEFHLDTWGNATVVVKNSKIVSNHHSRGGYIKFINCTISDNPWHDTGVRFLYGGDVLKYMPYYVYEFENSVIGPYAELSVTDDRINITFKGNLSMHISPDKVHWFGGTITREYNAIVLDKKQKPIPNQTLILFDSNGEKIWEKTTNKNGQLYFNLVFNKDNYNKKFLLQAMINNSTIEKEVSFFTETPILLSKKMGVRIIIPKEIYFMSFTIVIIAAIIILIIFKKRR